MTVPDPDAPSAPDAAEAEPPRPLFGLAYWVMIAFAVACIAGGYLVARLGPKLFPPNPAPAAAPGRFKS